MVMNLPANAGDVIDSVSTPGSRRSLGGRNGILAWEIPWTEEPVGLTFYGIPKCQTRLKQLNT